MLIILISILLFIFGYILHLLKKDNAQYLNSKTCKFYKKMEIVRVPLAILFLVLFIWGYTL